MPTESDFAEGNKGQRQDARDFVSGLIGNSGKQTTLNEVEQIKEKPEIRVDKSQPEDTC